MSTSPRVAPARVALVLLAVAAYGAWACGDIIADGLTGPHRSSLNAYFHLFGTLEPLPIAVLACFALLVFAVTRGATGETVEGGTASVTLTRTGALVIAVAVTCVAWLVQRAVMHGFPLSLDEFNTGFEASILASGRIFQPVRDEWIAFVPAIKPVFVAWRSADLSWYSGYIPVYAAARAAFQTLHLAAWLNPLCAGASVLLVSALARTLRPDDRSAPMIAALALMTSAQFLVTSGSQYTMPAHLLANLAWTWLVLRDDRASILAAALLGGVALGLHNPFPHALFALPFFWRWLQRREYARFAVTALVYLAFAALWLAWLRMERSGDAGQGGGLLSFFTLPGLEGWRLTGMNLVLLFSWQAPIIALLLAMALVGEKRLNAHEQDLARGVVLTFLFYVLYGSSQGHGWGYRYLYGVLGSVALLSAAAAPWLAESIGRRRARWLVGAGFALGLLVIPLRLVQVEAFVAPFARASAYVAGIDADVVAVETGAVWYGRDLIRNDPTLSRPVVVNGSMLNDVGWNALRTRFGARLALVPADSLVAHGMQRLPPRPPRAPPAP